MLLQLDLVAKNIIKTWRKLIGKNHHFSLSAVRNKASAMIVLVSLSDSWDQPEIIKFRITCTTR